MRLKNKIAIVVGAGQSPGEGLGNGRATVLRFAQEGAKVLAVDNNQSLFCRGDRSFKWALLTSPPETQRSAPDR